MKILNKSFDWIRTHCPREKVNKYSIISILIYYYIGLLSYITVPFKPIYSLLVSSSPVAVILRALITALIIINCVLILIVNKEKPKWHWIVLFVFIIFLSTISTLISPQTYNYIYVSRDNYQVVVWARVSTGIGRLFTMLLSSISDFALAFCFLFVLPIAINRKKQILLLLLPIIFIGLLECGYSIIRERGEYIKLINMADPQFGGYNINIGATFGNKQDWGAFACVSFVSAIGTFILLDNKGWKNKTLRIICIVSSAILFVFTIASLCKTAIIAEFVVYVCLIVYLGISLFRANKKGVGFILFAIIVGVIVLSLILFFAIPALHTGGLKEKIYKVLMNFIIGKINTDTTEGRSVIWLRLIENLRTYNLFFGLTKGGVATYSQVVTVEGQSSIHNGVAYFLASYGVFGFAIYLVLLAIVIKNIFKIWKINIAYMFFFIGTFGAALIFSLVEAEVLIVSGSNPIFVFNILLCSYCAGLANKNKETKEEINSSLSTELSYEL